MPRRRISLAGVGVHEAEGFEAEAGGELGAAPVGLVGDLDDGGAEGEAGAGRQVVGAQVEVDVELVAGQGPPVGVDRDQGRHPGVHEVQLHVGMGLAVVGAGAAPDPPAVAHQAVVEVEGALDQHLPLTRLGPADDELHPSPVGG